MVTLLDARDLPESHTKMRLICERKGSIPDPFKVHDCFLQRRESVVNSRRRNLMTI